MIDSHLVVMQCGSKGATSVLSMYRILKIPS